MQTERFQITSSHLSTDDSVALPAFERLGLQTFSDAIVRHLNTSSEEFSYATTAIAHALEQGRRVTIAVNNGSETGREAISSWRCVHDVRGMGLIPFALDAYDADDIWQVVGIATQLTRGGGRGDLLVACDPWGDNEALCHATRFAARAGMTTISITSDMPSMLAAAAGHPVRVPCGGAGRQDSIVAALRYAIQTVGGSLTSRRRTLPTTWISVLN